MIEALVEASQQWQAAVEPFGMLTYVYIIGIITALLVTAAEAMRGGLPPQV